VSSRRGIPTSRAYWELKADQLLNRVFDPVPAIEVELCDTPSADAPVTTLHFTGVKSVVPEAPSEPAAPVAAATVASAAAAPVPAAQAPAAPVPAAAPAAPPAPAAAPAAEPAPVPPSPPAAAPRPRPPAVVDRRIPWHRPLGDWVSARPGMALAGFSGICLLMGGSSLVFLGYWNATQQALRQERNLLLVERLRALGPAAPAPAGAEGAASATAPAAGDGVSASLPPPPPDEPWMEELADLPSGGAPAAAPLRVPVSSSIAQPAPASSGGGGGSAPVEVAVSSGGGGGDAPQLVGVVQVPGRGGSAIFQIGGTSTTAGVGESIGGSGWRLRSAAGDTAVIERGGQQRRISISSGF
jgi:hypothetical protein